MDTASATLDVVPAAVVVPLEMLVEVVESSTSVKVFVDDTDVTLVCVVDGELNTEEDPCAGDVKLEDGEVDVDVRSCAEPREEAEVLDDAMDDDVV